MPTACGHRLTVDRGPANEMIRFLGQMLKLPLAAVVAGMEIVTRAMRDFQKAVDQGVEMVMNGEAGNLASVPAPEFSEIPGSPVIEGQTTEECTKTEDAVMPDQDLSGDDLKYVSYTIVFTKRDYETSLRKQENELVNYPTDGGSYGGLKIAHFMADVASGKVKRPPEWQPPNTYPPDATDEYHWSIPRDDERYIQFVFQVNQRIPKQDADYERRQARALEAIRDKL